MPWPEIALVVAVLAAAPLAAGETDWKGRLEESVRRALAQNPSIARMESEVEASWHRIGQATALPDPEIEAGILNVPTSTFSLSQDFMTMEQFGARQRFPAAGTRPARRRLAEAAASSLSSMHEDHVVRLSGEVADAFFAVAGLDGRIAVLELSRERLARVAASASERYRVGKGAQADVLQANVEATAVDERLAGLRGERRAMAARLNTLQGLPPFADVAPIPIPESEPEAPGFGALLRRAEETSPAVAAAAARVRGAEEERALADLEKRPEISAFAYYAHRVDFDDMAGASVGLTLPFFQPKRLREKAAEKEAGLSGARADLELVKNEIRRGVAEAYAGIEAMVAQADLFRGTILPQAEISARAAQEAYMVGQVDFSTYIRASLDRDSYEAGLVERQAGAWRALAALQMASGLPLLPGTPGRGDLHVEK